KGVALGWKWNGFLVLAVIFCHSYQPVAGTRHRRFLKGSRKVGAVWTRSERALMVAYDGLPSSSGFSQNGTRPQPAITNARPFPAGRMIGMTSVGATL